MNDLQLDDFQNWKKVNGERFSKVDYINGVCHTNHLSTDIYFASLDLFWPEFYQHNGMIFIKDSFDTKTKSEGFFDPAKENHRNEYWINLLSLDNFFEDGTQKEYEFFGRKLAESWLGKLEMDFPDKTFSIHIVNDDEDSWVTFHQTSNKEK